MKLSISCLSTLGEKKQTDFKFGRISKNDNTCSVFNWLGKQQTESSVRLLAVECNTSRQTSDV